MKVEESVKGGELAAETCRSLLGREAMKRDSHFSLWRVIMRGPGKCLNMSFPGKMALFVPQLLLSRASLCQCSESDSWVAGWTLVHPGSLLPPCMYVSHVHA